MLHLLFFPPLFTTLYLRDGQQVQKETREESCKGSLYICLQSLFKEWKHLPVRATPSTIRTDSSRTIQKPPQSPSEKLGHLKQAMFRSADKSIAINALKSALGNHSSHDLICFTFHNTLLIWENSEKEREGKQIAQREVLYAWMQLKKVGWTFPMLENVQLLSHC